MKKLIVQFLKFAVVGGLAFLIDAGIYLGLRALFGEDLHLIFNIIGFSVSVIFNYLCSMRFVFKGREDLSKTRELTIFIILSLIGLGINELIVWALVDVVHLGVVFAGFLPADPASNLAGFAAKVVATGVVLIWNFISRKIFLEEKSHS